MELFVYVLTTLLTVTLLNSSSTIVPGFKSPLANANCNWNKKKNSKFEVMSVN